MKTAGFHLRILLGACIFIAGAVLLMGYIGLELMQSYVEDRFEEKNQFLTRYLARNAELGILIKDEDMLSRLQYNLLSERDVIGVRIWDEQGRELSSSFQEGHDDEHAVSKAWVRTQSVPGRGTSIDLDAEQDETGQVIGQVAVYFSLESINRLQKSLRDKFGLLALVVGLISVSCFYLISKSLARPVNRLAQVASQVARGEKNVRAVPDKIPETRELAEAFNSMLDSLEQSQQALEQLYQDMARQKTMAELGKFAMLIAHEVKNPLGIIKSSLDILKAEPGLGQGHPMVEYIEDEIRRISQLLEDFLAFSRPARPHFQQVELNGLVFDYAQRFLVLYDNADLEVITQVQEQKTLGTADPDLLIKALHNLLKNAAEANDFSGRILVRTQIQDGHWVLEIEDQGPGIALETEEKIFEPFWTSKTKGSGLGLAFVAYVLEAHQGSIRAYNKSEGGAVFRVKMPC